MPKVRQKMRPWLVHMIESRSVAGVVWIDKNKTMFSIPWKHAARHGWEMDKDASLFKKWAIHTGKYVEGQTAPDPKTWKANFRCAMNSLPDVEEVKDKSVIKGHQAVRVFRMLPAATKSRGKQRKANKKMSLKKVKVEDGEESSDALSPAVDMSPDDSTQENTVDSTVNTDQQAYVPLCDVPEWASTVEIGPDSFSTNFHNRFEVSPDQSPDYDCNHDIKQICQQLDRESPHWTYSSVDDKGFLSKEECTSTGSQWSDSTSADELDKLPRYTMLDSDFPSATNELWNSFSPQISLML